VNNLLQVMLFNHRQKLSVYESSCMCCTIHQLTNVAQDTQSYI